MTPSVQPSAGPEAPTVGLGLPVYNGERYLEQTIRSILSQTFEDLSLVIGDNASTDGTEDICRSFEQDPRVTYLRRERNLGATPNYNDLMDRLDSPFVKWCAADDMLAPTYLEKCVERLRADDRASMAHARPRVVGPEGEPAGEWDGDRIYGHPDVIERWRALVQAGDWHSIFGLVRREVMDRVGVFPLYVNSDQWVLGGWLLHGPIAFVDEQLFIWRDHPDSFRRRVYADRAAANDWWVAGKKRIPLEGSYRALVHARRLIRGAPISDAARRDCRRILQRDLASRLGRSLRARFRRS